MKEEAQRDREGTAVLMTCRLPGVCCTLPPALLVPLCSCPTRWAPLFPCSDEETEAQTSEVTSVVSDSVRPHGL